MKEELVDDGNKMLGSAAGRDKGSDNWMLLICRTADLFKITESLF